MTRVAFSGAASAQSPTGPSKRPRARRGAPEQALQKTAVQFLLKFVPPPPEGPFWTAINPVPSKSKAVAGLSKAMGLRAGVPDLLLVYRGLPIFIEFKAAKGTLSEAQKELLPEMEAAGANCHEARSLDEFVNLLQSYGIQHCALRFGREVL